MYWVYQVLDEDYNLEWEWDLNDGSEYETTVDEWFNEYIAAKLFGFDPEDEYRNIESVWEMLYIKTDKYLKNLRKENEGNVKMNKMPCCPRCEEEISDCDFLVCYDSQMSLCCPNCISKCCADLNEHGGCAYSDRNWNNEDVCKCVWFCHQCKIKGDMVEAAGTYGDKLEPMCADHRDAGDYCGCGKEKESGACPECDPEPDATK